MQACSGVSSMITIDNFIARLKNLLGRNWSRYLLVAYLSFVFPVSFVTAQKESSVEYQVKAAFIYNFIAFTQWPENTGQSIRLCVYGNDPFGREIDKLESRPVHGRHINVQRISDQEALNTCQVIFFSQSVDGNLRKILIALQNQPILTLADNPDAITQGVVINMSLAQEKIVFEINLDRARQSGLDISSRLLQLAVKVHQ